MNDRRRHRVAVCYNYIRTYEDIRAQAIDRRAPQKSLSASYVITARATQRAPMTRFPRRKAKTFLPQKLVETPMHFFLIPHTRHSKRRGDKRSDSLTTLLGNVCTEAVSMAREAVKLGRVSPSDIQRPSISPRSLPNATLGGNPRCLQLRVFPLV